MVSVLLQQLLQLAMEQLLLSDVQLDHPLEVSGAVDVDVVAVKPQLLAGFVGQLDLHLDLDVAAPEHEADFVLLVLAGDPSLGSEQQGSLQGDIDQLGAPLVFTLGELGGGQIENPSKVAALGHGRLRSACEQDAHSSCCRV